MSHAIRTANEMNGPMTATESPLEDRLKIEDVIRRAYEIHRERGGWFGFDFEDWDQAWAEWPRKKQ